MKWKRVKHQRKRIASRHVERMLELSLDNLDERPERSRRYVQIARDMIRKHKVKLAPEQKGLFCKKCNTPLVPGRTSRVRTRSGMVSTTCLHCGNVRRHPFRKEKELDRMDDDYAEKKFPGGLLCARVIHKGNLIRSVKFTGDFFFYPEDKLFELEDELRNTELSRLHDRISRFYEREGVESPGVGPDSFVDVVRKAISSQ
ncbi:MAG TPA: lipoate protein ligase C-terminal domain-containing protein [Candidatus Methanofastidiosa archaeon]|nr:lipoate protein ligase C-terminal domain-containing protein [Candidatus Methanofastidiosa archaeon]HPR41352.1 lipoate protein ligase C-terminal domain-containing protein [Candidatus Methanofastidiosa archaeon]